MSAQRFLADIHAQPATLERVCTEYADGEQADALRAAAACLRSTAVPPVITGMGASYFALFAAKAVLDGAHKPVVLEDTAYLIEYGLPALREGQPVLVVSQSGRSAEATALAEQMPRSNPLIVVTNDTTTPLAQRADIVLPLLAEPDLSVALKTYTATVALLLMLTEQMCTESTADTRRRLLHGDPMSRAIERSEAALEAMVELAGDPGYAIALGRGASISSALGAGLLLKETAKLPAEGINGGQFRHGAVEVVGQGTFAMIFAPNGRAGELNRQLADELEAYGARVLVIGEEESPASGRRLAVAIDAADEYVAPVFEIVPAQLLSRAVAMGRGVEPGSFVNTTPVITTL
ncbi:SIS domain-containing protein [Planosporangium flavigriseum]|uniref:Glucosamine--fructose-6-phosphate aminotransferase n=1 Tax=Planosporangium flavigriseum TaxID=373681 RepID=A0A8J3LQY2_9ACTN|nr:SIS domain-containing protein [Planosporangium flavigriseum]NJC65549.1 SIS domain-containing protein [Planosporangium flavigriseum]GIG75013.1 glucosamine--fructose-6-phosphate aminotransferase [Planosporangium flavigriseum]